MVRLDREAGSFQIGTQKSDGTCNDKTSSVRCSQFMFLFIQSTGPVGNGTVAAIFLFLKEYTPDLFVANIAIECVLPFCFR